MTLSLKRHFPYQIDFDVHNGQVLQFDFLSATLLGQGHFEGNSKKAYLKGKFDVTKSEIELPRSFGSGLPKLPCDLPLTLEKEKVLKHFKDSQNLCLFTLMSI